jgi:sigma-54 dependent transcriptional regulator, acetoin dehydrogenase operon transcriptional activator AcoR
MEDTHNDSPSSSDKSSVPLSPQLVIVLECDRPLSGGARHSLDGIDLVTIGRGAERGVERSQEGGLRTLDVRIPGRSVSTTHARLVRAGSTWAIEDLGSTNGTLVNGQRVRRAVLGDDDVFETGHVLMRVNPTLPMPAGAPLDVDIRSENGSGHQTLDPSFACDLERTARLAVSRVPIVLIGESGTGKEVLARWLHERDGQCAPFVAVNCGAIPATLVESQLFGHVKGAFSGAVRDELGFVRAADGGTLFLDEIADLPKQSQAALLRVLQEGEVIPVGTTQPLKVCLRVIAATHQPLEELVERGDFRHDLFARLAGCVILLPALRARRDDLGVLIAAILPKIARERASTMTFSSEVGQALTSHSWPLNVRELEQCIATSVALAPNGKVKLAHLPRTVIQGRKTATVSSPSADVLASRDEALRLELLELLSRHHGNLAAVARAVGKAPMQVHRWCRRFGIDPRPFRR